VTEKFKYRGNLAETPLPEMLYTIDRFRIPGIVEAKHDGVIKRVFVRDGYIVHASSSDRSDSLGDYLERLGSVEPEQLAKIKKERDSSSKRFGVLCIERGILSPVEVFEFVRAQIEGIVWSLFYWHEGEVTFGIGALTDEEMIQIQLSIGQVVVQGIRQAPDAKPLVARLGDKDTILEPSYRLEDLIELCLDTDDYRLLSMVDGKRSLYQLLNEGPRTPPENAKVLYAYQAWNLVRRQRSQQESKGPVKIQLKTAGDGFQG
jgi:hypothetical protein